MENCGHAYKRRERLSADEIKSLCEISPCLLNFNEGAHSYSAEHYWNYHFETKEHLTKSQERILREAGLVQFLEPLPELAATSSQR